MANPYPSFKDGEKVEITSASHWHRGALFPGIIIGPSLEENKLMVEYKTIMDPNDQCGLKKPLREAVNLGLLRPLPPQESVDYCFMFGDLVDAFFNGGWWEGTITEVLEENSTYKVYFRFCKKQLKFKKSQLRIHREFVKGTWQPPFSEEDVTSEVNTNIVRTEEKFSDGTPVEVRTDEDGFQGAWFAATIVKAVGKGKFLVEYEKLRTDDDKEFLKEEIDIWHLRPIPPEAIVVDGYTLNEAVDALYNDGWWEGVISKVLQKSRYKIYFKNTDEDMVFEHSDLRPHYDWIDGTWVMSSQALKF